jgi:SAM-dependent methyltransferase
MFHVLKKLVPGSWRNQFRRIIRDTSGANKIDQLEQQVVQLSQHIHNLSQLTVSTTNNLEAVGEAVKGLDGKYESRLVENERVLGLVVSDRNFLKDEFVKITFDNSKSQMCNLLYFQHIPEVYPVSTQTTQLITQFKKEFNVNFKFFEGIAKNDIMFLTSLLHIGNYPLSYHSYLSTGLNGFNLIRRILTSANGHDRLDGKLLDFASGYGRVTRFLAGYYSPEKIHTSDIKPEAVDFQTQHLGVHGFYSSYNPAEVQVNEKYQAIFVGSLFSHLNQDLYFRWLHQLIHLTREDGLLIFSVHDITLYPEETKEDHIYVLNNEDAPFSFVEDRITAMNDYGVSFSTENFVKKQLAAIHPDLKYVRYKKGFGGLQDVYVVTRTGTLPAEDLDLSQFP